MVYKYKGMMKTGLFTALIMALCLFYVETTFAATPKAETEVIGEHVRLGDIFDGVEKHADTIITRAPAPGESMVLNVYALYQISNAFNLGWKPVSHYDQTIVKRAATIVETQEIKDAIIQALATDHLEGKFELDMNNPTLRLILPGDLTSSVRVMDSYYDAASNQFRAIIQAPAEGGANARRVTVTGRVAKLVEIPVLSERLGNGELITPHNIEWITVRADKIRKDIVMTEDSLIGKTPRRSLLPGVPVRQRDITMPLMVERGDMITMKIKTGKLSLTARAKAMSDGAEGEMIRAVNIKSNKVVEGIITGVREMTVLPNDVMTIN